MIDAFAHQDGYAPAAPAPGASNPERRESDDPSAVPLVPRDGFFEGQVAVIGRTRVEGTVRGSLRGSGELILGPEARVEGAVECDVVSCCGVIIGPVVARVRLHLKDGARFEGDLDAPVVQLDGEAIWIGVARVGG